MAEDMTYTPVQTLADARQRIAELERENAELRARLDTVLGYAHYYHSFWGSGRVAIPHAPLTFDEWYEDLPQPADDTDAPLTLAAIEDGDE